MNFVFQAHSGLRYLVFLMVVVALVVFAEGLSRGRAFGRFHRVVGASYAGLVHLQASLGLVLVAMGKFYPRLIGHVVTMLAAAVSLQVLLSLNLRRPKPGFLWPLIGVVVTMACFAAGLAAIGRGLFEATPFVPPRP
jgi:hypothetical protein